MDYKYKISDEFTKKPGPRFKDDGKHSGEEFKESFLDKLFNDARSNSTKLIIDLDDVIGYGPSFIDQSFGELQRENPTYYILDTISFICKDQPFLIKRIEENVNKYYKGSNR